MSRKRKPTKKRLQRVSIRAELRQPVDWDKYAYALIQHVRIQQQAAKKTHKGKSKR